MPENYVHYISRNIKAFYRRRLIMPVLYLITIAVIWIIFSLQALLSPIPLGPEDLLAATYQNGTEYVHATLTDLDFTGYTRDFLGYTTGYYYYTVRNGECIIALLSPGTSEEGLPTISEASFSGKIVRGGDSFDQLLTNLAADLSWTKTGLLRKVSHYYISEPDCSTPRSILLFAVVFGTGGYALICIFLYIFYLFFPEYSPPCQNLSLFGNPKKLLAQAEEELATLPQLATEDMFITEHFFIETSVYGNAIVPIDQIIWIYKYSTLHKFFRYHFSISYTLHITANRHLYIRCPKNIKSDIDGIIDYLSEANHNILVGFSEENRLKAQKIQGTPVLFEKILKRFKKRR